MPLQDFITAQHRRSLGYKPNPAFADFKAAIESDPDLLTEAQAEFTRLCALRDADVFQRDYESKARHKALAALLNLPV